MLEKNLQTEWENLRMNRDELLSGDVWSRKGANMTPVQLMPKVVYTQIFTVVQRAMEEEAERSTVSHEGTRQLLFASNMLPRNVLGPEWLPAGLSSFFETSPSALYTSTGMPSWGYLTHFKYYRKTGKLGKSPEVLYNLVTDRYFRQARRSAEQVNLESEGKDKTNEKFREDKEIAYCTAWSLIYHLAEQRKLHYLMRFCEEINNLPRDLDIEERTWLGCFARAFEMVDRTDPSLPDMAALQRFADSWYSGMDNVSLELPDMERFLINLRTAQAAVQTKKGPTTPTSGPTPTPGPIPTPTPGGSPPNPAIIPPPPPSINPPALN